MAARARWFARISGWGMTEQDFKRIYASLQREEREKIGRLMFADDVRRAIAGRALIRRAVKMFLGISFTGAVLQRTKEGKPYLVRGKEGGEAAAPAAAVEAAAVNPVPFPGFNFNVSHAGDLVVLACEPEELVGVDVMDVREPNTKPLGEFFRIMKRQFTDAEWERIKAADSEQQRLINFFKYWTLKESYVKAVGVGLGLDLLRLSFVSGPVDGASVTSEASLRIDGRPQPAWRFEQSFIDAEHLVSVALGPRTDAAGGFQETLAGDGDGEPVAAGQEAPLPFEEVSFAQLIEHATPRGDTTPAELDAAWLAFSAKKDKLRR